MSAKEKKIELNVDTLSVESTYKVKDIRHLTDSTYVIRMNRNGMDFTPGQHITLGLGGDNQVREYSLYSSNNEDYLEVLIKEVEDGIVSRKLKKCQEGDTLNADGPFGFFTIEKEMVQGNKFLLISTGTGISPYHSMIQSYPELDYQVIQGVRFGEEAYDRSDYDPERFVLCTSRDEEGDFHGRVTDYLQANKPDSDSLVYLCGNCDMIYEVYDLLTSAGIPSDNIRTEVYF